MDSNLPKFFQGKTVILLQQCFTTDLLTELQWMKASQGICSAHPCWAHPHFEVLSPLVPSNQTLSKQLVLLLVLTLIDKSASYLYYCSYYNPTQYNFTSHTYIGIFLAHSLACVPVVTSRDIVHTSYYTIHNTIIILQYCTMVVLYCMINGGFPSHLACNI